MGLEPTEARKVGRDASVQHRHTYIPQNQKTHPYLSFPGERLLTFAFSLTIPDMVYFLGRNWGLHGDKGI